MSVRGKFTLVSILPTGENCKLHTFAAVTTGSPENESFAAYTPYGLIQMSVDADTEAAGQFEVGKDYYVDFTAVEDESSEE